MSSAASFRFLHSGNFDLGGVPDGMFEMPSHLRDFVLDASWQAANNVFRTAIENRVDFVLLVGNLVHEFARGPRGAVFLRDRCDELQAAGIDVCLHDHGQGAWWSDWCAFPDNVHIVGSRTPDTVISSGSGDVIARIRSGERAATPADQGFRIAVFADDFSANGHDVRCDYAAVAGNAGPHSFASTGACSRAAGTPQARRPSPTGPRGCLIVHVSSGSQIDVEMIETDMMRWVTEHVVPDAPEPLEGVESLLLERARALQESAGQALLIVNWQIEGPCVSSGELWKPRVRDGLLQRLRNEFGHQETFVWSQSLGIGEPGAAARTWAGENALALNFLEIVENHPHRDRFERAHQAELEQLRSLGVGLPPAGEQWLGEILCNAEQIGLSLLKM